MEIGVSTRKTVSSPAKNEIVIPPVATIVTEVVRSPVTDDVEVIKAVYEDQIAKIHENYQYVLVDLL
jgi:hypothetical protein